MFDCAVEFASCLEYGEDLVALLAILQEGAVAVAGHAFNDDLGSGRKAYHNAGFVEGFDVSRIEDNASAGTHDYVVLER